MSEFSFWHWMMSLFIFGFSFTAYFFPVIIAYIRKHNNLLALGLLNLFLGWTGLGWIGALVWACINGKEQR